MASHQQDAYIDDSEDSCPLCVEEFDLSDKNFKPCPCGYQICQFCFNNIRNNLNGMCPACRRPYDDKTIEWKIVSTEEFKADVAAQARKRAAARQKEAERKQVESMNRKHLSGLRVLQKNLVYVLGMGTTGSDDDLELLRGPQHFGQYGKIVKIAASKAREGYGGHQSAGIYVTFANKDDAKDCIAALDGTVHGGRMLKAQYGTTKYCSAFLRNETCNNRNCTFLHETGDENDSFSRQDLSSLNAISSQRPVPGTAAASSSKSTHQLPARPQAYPPGLSQVPAAHSIKSEAMSRSDSGDGSALPTSASWAKNPQVEQSRRSSQAASRATPSPKATVAKMAPQRPDSRAAHSKELAAVSSKAKSPAEAPQEHKAKEEPKAEPQEPSPTVCRLVEAIKAVKVDNFLWSLDRNAVDESMLDAIAKLPPLIDNHGGIIRLSMKHQQDVERQKLEEEQAQLQGTQPAEEDEVLASGSLQLGGEPETAEERKDGSGQAISVRGAANAGGPGIAANQQYNSHSSLLNDLSTIGLGERSMTPQQQQNLALLKNNRPGQDAGFDQFQRGPSGNTSQHQSQLSNPFQNQNQQLSALSRHARQSSRYTFANDTSSASTAITPATNAQLLAQQSAMMPPNQQKSFPGQTQVPPNLQTSFYSGVQGPPPGLKSSGTPPISGGGMFGQGHGFAKAMGGSASYGFNNAMGKGNNDDLLRDIIRSRSGMGGNMGADSAKIGAEFAAIPSPRQQPQPSGHDMNAGEIFPSSSGRTGTPITPIAPPGLSKPSEFPPLVAPTAYEDNGPHPASSLPAVAQSQRVKPAVPSLPPIGTRSMPAEKNEKSKQPEPAKETLIKGTGIQEAFEEVSGPKAEDDAAPQPKEGPQPKEAPQSRESLHPKETPKAKELAKEKGGRDMARGKSKTVKAETIGKRQRPKRLEIPVKKPSEAEEKLAAETSRSSQAPALKPQQKEGISSSSRPGTPTTAVSQSSASSMAPRQPRTLRVISTPKVEPPQEAEVSGLDKAVKDGSTVLKQPDAQQPMSASKQPRTFAQDAAYDSASLTSTPISRPVSPNRKQAADISTKKAKDAKRDAKATKDNGAKALGQTAGPSTQEEIIQEPIIGRKKKAKKPKALSSLQASSEAFSDSPLETPEVPQSASIRESPAATPKNNRFAPVEASYSPKKTPANRFTPIVDEHVAATPAEPPAPTFDKAKLTAAALFGELVKRGEMGAEALDMFLHPINGGGGTAAVNRLDAATLAAADPDGPTALVIADADKRRLDNGEPIVVGTTPPCHAVILPDRSMLRFLLRDEAERYLRLRRDLMLAGRVPATALTGAAADLPVEGSISIAGGLYGKGDDEEALLRASAAAAAAAAADGGHDFCLPNPQDMAQEHGAAAVTPDDAASFSAYYSRRPPANDGLAERIMGMSTEESDRALKESENEVQAARKEQDALEKKLGQSCKRNRKMLKEWSKE